MAIIPHEPETPKALDYASPTRQKGPSLLGASIGLIWIIAVSLAVILPVAWLLYRLIWLFSGNDLH